MRHAIPSGPPRFLPLAAGLALLVLPAPEVAAQDPCSATRGVAIPVRHLVASECAAPAATSEGLLRVQQEIRAGNARVREQLADIHGAYRSKKEWIQTASDFVDIARGVPGWKMLPFADEAAGVLKTHLVQYASQSNRVQYHADIKAAFARALVANPELRSRPYEEVRAAVVEEFASVMAPEDFSAVGSIVQAELSREMGAIRQELDYLREQVVRNAEADSDAASAPLRDLEGNVVQLERDFEAAEKHYRQAAQSFMEDVDRSLSIQRQLVARQEEIASTVEQHEEKIAENERKIAENRREIQRLESRVGGLETKVGEHSEMIGNLQALQRETAALVAENTQRLDAVSAVLYGNVDAAGKLALIESGAHRVPDREATVKMLETQVQLDQFDAAVQMGGDIVAAGQALGLSDLDADNANRALGYLQLGTNVARMMSGDVSAALAVITGAGSLFGGQEQGPDPFQEAVMAQFERLNLRMDALAAEVDVLGSKMDSLLVRQVRHQAVLLDEIAFLNGRIDVVDAKLDYLVAALQDASLPECRSAGGSHAELFQGNVRAANTFAELRNSYMATPDQNSLPECARVLLFAAAPYNVAYLHNRASASDLVQSYEQLRAFDLGPIANSSFLKTNDRCSAAPLLDPTVVAVATELMLDLEPVMYFAGDGALMEPSSLSTSFHVQRQGYIEDGFRKWGEVIACTLAQQSLVTGGTLFGEPVLHVLSAPFLEADRPERYQRLTRAMLQSEFHALHTNLAAFLVRSGFESDVSLYTALGRIQTGAADPDGILERLNRELQNQSSEQRLVVHPVGGGRASVVGLEVSATLAGEEITRILPLPPAELIWRKESVFSGATERLVELHRTVIERAEAYRVSQTLADNDAAQTALDALVGQE